MPMGFLEANLRDVTADIEPHYQPSIDAFAFQTTRGMLYFDDYANRLTTSEPAHDRDKLPSSIGQSEAFSVKIVPSNACQLACSYCFSQDDRMHNHARLDFAAIRSKLLEIRDTQKVLQISFTGGGEPTTNMDVIEKTLELFGEHPNAVFHITSNGMFNATTREWLSRAPFESIALSIDGAYHHASLQQERPLSRLQYDTAISNAVALLNAGKNVKPLCVSTMRAIEDDPQCLALSAQFFWELGFRKMSLEYDMGIFHQALTDRQTKALIQSAVQLMSWKRQHKNCMMVNSVISKPSRFSMESRCVGIVATGRHCSIMPDGTVSFCHRVQNGRHFDSMADWVGRKMDQVVASQRLSNAVRLTEQFKARCQSCISRQICLSHICPATTMSGQLAMENYCRNMLSMRRAILTNEIKYNVKEKKHGTRSCTGN